MIEQIKNILLAGMSGFMLRVLTALIIFLLGFIIGRIAGRLIERALKEAELNSFLKRTANINFNAESVISGFIMYSIYFLTILASLEQLGVASIILYILAATAAVIILVSFFMAARDFLPNLIAGFYMYSKIREGNTIEIDKVKGTIEKIELLHIKIRTKSGDIIYVPNSLASRSNLRIR